MVPFGCGASIFYNYVDFQFRNDTPYTFQLVFWLDEKYINGDLRSDSDLPFAYHIAEKNHAFIKKGEEFYRTNELWRNKVSKVSGDTVESACLQRIFSLVKYVPEEFIDYEDVKFELPVL